MSDDRLEEIRERWTGPGGNPHTAPGDVAWLVAEVDRLRECMHVAGLQAFMRGKGAREVAEHLRDVRESYQVIADERPVLLAAKAVADAVLRDDGRCPICYELWDEEHAGNCPIPAYRAALKGEG